MATYKLMQDIEAEDHILGPLSLRQFIFALIAAFCIYMIVVGVTKHITILLPIFVPVALFCLFFAIPWGGDQPTEIWALAKLRFYFKPRKRIWDQSGVKELVTITVPKKIEPILTDGLSQFEVKSRLHALANTLDSRGWAVKGVDINTYSNPDPMVAMSTDRLLPMDNMPVAVPSYEVHAADDMLDVAANPVAQQFDQMIAKSEQNHRRLLIDEMNGTHPAPAPAQSQPQPPAPAPQTAAPDYWFMSPSADAAPRPGKAASAATPIQAPGSNSVVTAKDESPEEEAMLAAGLKAQASYKFVGNTHMKTITPLGSQPPQPPTSDMQTAVTEDQARAVVDQPAPTPPAPDPAILSLANNNDLDVATLARQANKAKRIEATEDQEVVISLH